MKFFLYSKCGEGSGLLKKIKDEGNEVAMFIQDEAYRTVYKGILDQRESVGDKDTIVIFDSSGMGDKADKLKRNGYKVFGASSFADQLENDREFGLEFMKNHSISVPETKNFTSSDWNDAKSFIQKNKNQRFVFKPCGDLPSKLTYCGQDSEDLIGYMEYVQKTFKITDFVLQQFIEGSIISSEYFVGPNGFVGPINHTIEAKKFMNEDIGPSTGCSGNIVWIGEEDSKLSKLLAPIEQSLVKERYIGPIDLNCIISEGEVFGLEWTPRFGLDAMPTFLQLLNMDAADWIYSVVNGGKLKLHEDQFAGGIRVTIPPYPIELDNVKTLKNQGIPIRGLDLVDPLVYFYEIMLEGDKLVHSAGTGVIAVVSDKSDDIEQCFFLPMNMIEDCKIPDKQYRTDLAQIFPEMYNEIEEMVCSD